MSAIVGEGSKLDWYEGVEVVSRNAREGKWHNCSTIEDHNPFFSHRLELLGQYIIFLRGFKELFLVAWRRSETKMVLGEWGSCSYNYS